MNHQGNTWADSSPTYSGTASESNCWHCGRSCNCSSTTAQTVWIISTRDSGSTPALSRKTRRALERLKLGEEALKARMAHLDFVESLDDLIREQERRKQRVQGRKPAKRKKPRGGRRAFRNTKQGARPKRR